MLPILLDITLIIVGDIDNWTNEWVSYQISLSKN